METITLGLNAAQQAPNMSFMLIIYIVIFVGLMWFMSRKSRKQEREEAAMRNNLMIGDEITTIGGIVGRITHIKDDIVTIETGADRTKIRFRKFAVRSVDKKYDEEKSHKGGYKVTGVKKEKVETPIEAPVLKEENK